MKTTIRLSGDAEKDIQRLEEIKTQINKERLEFLEREPKLREQQRENFLKRIFTTRDNPIEVRKKKIIRILSSEHFKKHFYGLQKLSMPLTWYQKLEKWVRLVIHNIDERFRTKSHIELLMDRISLMDEMNLLEKRIKMAKYGIDPMIDRDLDENDKIELKNQNEELNSYRKELGDFLKNDPEYIKLRDDERQMNEDALKNMEVHRILWEEFEIKPKEGEIDPRQELPYDSFTSTLPDTETPQ